MQPNFRMSLLSKLNVVDKSTTPILQLLCTFQTQANELLEEKSLETRYLGTCMGRVFLMAEEQGTMKSWIIPTTKTHEQGIVLPWSGNVVGKVWEY